MDEVRARTAWALVDSLRRMLGTSEASAGAEGVATVSRVDSQGVPWVSLPGAEGETPVNGQVLADVDKGNVVRYQIGGGSLSIMGNATAPAVGGGYVQSQVAPVAERADDAMTEAIRAHGAAESAEEDALRAHDAADNAQQSADDAGASATSARTSANAALYELGVIEDVVGTVEWLAAHVEYSLTADTSVTPGKVYYALVGSSYQPQAVPELTYSQTSDATPQDGTTYYVLVGGSYVEADVSGGFESGVTYYTAAPTNPSALGLYEASASESVQAYIASHLALTDDGLWLTADEGGYRLRLSTSGWEVLDADGQPVAATLADGLGHVVSTLGRLDGLHLTVTESRLSFGFPNGGEVREVAWIEVDPSTGTSSFHITNAVVMAELRIGSWKWFDRAGGNLALKWIGA